MAATGRVSMRRDAGISVASRRIEGLPGANILFSICTLVTDVELYRSMCQSFRQHGFDGDDVEFLYIDNAMSNVFDAYEGLNCLISHARGRYVVLCHQDIVLIEDGRTELLDRLGELDALDPGWALAGNAGVFGRRRSAHRITDRDGVEHKRGSLPHYVHSLDENFIVMKGESRLGFSCDLKGFHLYGADICLQAEVRGWTAYVIDFHLRHNGIGTMGEPFIRCRLAIEQKYGKFMVPRSVGTTCAVINLAPSGPRRALRRLWQNLQWCRRYVWKRMRGKPAPPRE